MNRHRLAPSQTERRLLRVLLVAIFCVVGLSPAWAETEAGPTTTVGTDYHIAPGSLTATLSAFAGTAGITLAIDPALVQRLDSKGLSGTYGIEDGLAALLAGSGLQAAHQGNGNYVLQRAPDGAMLLPAVKVEAAMDLALVTEGTLSYTTNAVMIGKADQSLRQIPQSVSVITRQRLDDQNLSSLETAVAQSTGFTVLANSPGSGFIYARGFPIDTFMFDGVAQNHPDYAYSKPDLAPYDRVEIIRGSAGLLQGSGNPSAAINLVRKRPGAQFAASVAAYGGSWDYYRTELDAGGPLNASGSLRARVVAAHEDRDYYVDVAESQRAIFYGVAEYDLTPDTLLVFGAQSQRIDAVPIIYGVPRYNDSRPLPLPRSAYLAPDWNDWSQDLTQVFASIEHRFDNGWKAKLSLEREWEAARAKRTITAGPGWAPIDPATGNGLFSGSAWDDDYDREGLDANISGPVSFAGRSHTLTAGISTRSSGVDRRSRALGDTAIDDLLDFDPHVYPEPADPVLTNLGFNDDRQYGVYGSSRFGLSDSVTLVLGGRVDWYKVSMKSRNFDTGIVTTGADYSIAANFMPYLGLVWDLGEHWSLYSSYADIFQPQLYEFTHTGKALDPIVGANYEIGIKGEFLDGALNASLALFRIEQENRAQEDLSQPCVSAAVQGWCYVAQGEVRSEGVEVEVSGRLLPSWQVFAGYTFNTTEYVKDRASAGSVFMTQTPKHLLRLWTHYQLSGDWNRLGVGGGVNAQSAYYVEQAGLRVEQRTYAVVSARLAWHFSERFSAALNGNNLLDKRYFSAIGAGYGNVYGDPRNFMLTARYEIR